MNLSKDWTPILLYVFRLLEAWYVSYVVRPASTEVGNISKVSTLKNAEEYLRMYPLLLNKLVKNAVKINN